MPDTDQALLFLSKIVRNIDSASYIGKVIRFLCRIESEQLVCGDVESDREIIEVIVSPNNVRLIIRCDADFVAVWDIECCTGKIAVEIDR